MLADMRAGWRHLSGRPGLIAVVTLYGVVGALVAPAEVLITPMVLSFANSDGLGIVLGLFGLGAVVGSLLLTAPGAPRRRVRALAGCTFPIGVFMALGALRPSVALVAVAAFGYQLFSTYVDGTARGILQTQTDPDVQGRVFALFNMVASTVQCVAFAAAGPLADVVFEPLVHSGGPLAGRLDPVIGSGAGRGAALLVLLCGVGVMATAVVAARSRGLRSLPDRTTGDADRIPDAPLVLTAADREPS
jgi:hypothetical protein